MLYIAIPDIYIKLTRNNMIRLRDLLHEITLGSVTPYATQFVWRDNWGDGESFECKWMADSQPITMTMTYWRSSEYGSSGEWQFAYFVRSADDNGWTTTAQYGGARGQIDTLRLFRTLGEAIRDFATTRNGVDVIDITGSDTAEGKSAQKTRIYTNLLETNPDLAEFTVLTGRRGQLFLVRRSILDAPANTTDTDTDDYYAPDGSEDDTDDDMGWMTDMSFDLEDNAQ